MGSQLKPSDYRRRRSLSNLFAAPEWWNGRHDGLKIRWGQPRVSSTLTSGTFLSVLSSDGIGLVQRELGCARRFAPCSPLLAALEVDSHLGHRSFGTSLPKDSDQYSVSRAAPLARLAPSRFASRSTLTSGISECELGCARRFAPCSPLLAALEVDSHLGHHSFGTSLPKDSDQTV